MKTGTNPIRVGLAAYPGSQSAAIYGLQDLFAVANRFQQDQATQISPMETETISNFPAHGSALRALILPPALGQRVEGATERQLVAWVQHHHRQGALICSICAGAFPLAASGLLDGRQATTHWALAPEFANRFPAVHLQADRLVVDDGDVITAGGLMAWTDLGLRLIARFMGPALMLKVARFFLIDPGERAQSFYSSFSPNLAHGDTAILRAQHWVQSRYAHTVSVRELAEAAQLELRTFGRRFQAATGFSPSEYVQQLRIAKARERLELSQASIDTIAHEVGYLDISAFRRMFHKIVGLSPGEYRKRFSPAVK
ncbi:GlxA family transcriptional regulator [Ruegeria halocynthiae]|uniref:GlxA family transcriptional regulator n=1 Tax=Ruegeria halocynthiae TaxID=985054 RepID=UPI000561C7E1|nr:GlxA family transcriptional regulator [Ruegeria halocynthiae]